MGNCSVSNCDRIAIRRDMCGAHYKRLIITGSVRPDQKIRKLHGHARVGKKTPEYRIWINMMNRCYYEKANQYMDYGGRGIKVCQHWHDFSNFLSDVGEKPKGMTIDRINNDGNYEPENVKWSNRREQNRNKRNNVLLTHNAETRCCSDWGDRTGIDGGVLSRRAKEGWPVERILFEKPKPEKEWKLVLGESVADLSARSGIGKATIYKRLKRGIPIEKLLDVKTRDRRSK